MPESPPSTYASAVGNPLQQSDILLQIANDLKESRSILQQIATSENGIRMALKRQKIPDGGREVLD